MQSCHNHVSASITYHQHSNIKANGNTLNVISVSLVLPINFKLFQHDIVAICTALML